LLIPGIMEKCNTANRSPLELLCLSNNYEKMHRFLILNANFEQLFHSNGSCKCALEYIIKSYFDDKLVYSGINKDLLELLIKKYYGSCKCALEYIIKSYFDDKLVYSGINKDLLELLIKKY